MNKHLFGFALFSLIVGTTIFIYGVFHITDSRAIHQSVDYSNYSQTKSCWKMKQSHRENLGLPRVTQAIFDVDSKQLRWELDTSEVDTPITLNFFVREKNGMRYINSALVPVLAYRDGSVRATSSYEWLDNLDSYENLYVIAEPIAQGEYQSKSFQHEFDASKATAVLLY